LTICNGDIAIEPLNLAC